MADAPDVLSTEPAARYTDSLGKYIVIYLCILALAAVQFVFAYSGVHSGGRFARMFLVALAEGGLALLFFMHLWDQKGTSRLTMAIAVLFVLLLITLTISDAATRFPLALDRKSVV